MTTVEAAYRAVHEFVQSLNDIDTDVVDLVNEYLVSIWRIDDVNIRAEIIQRLLQEIKNTAVLTYVEGYEY